MLSKKTCPYSNPSKLILACFLFSLIVFIKSGSKLLRKIEQSDNKGFTSLIESIFEFWSLTSEY